MNSTPVDDGCAICGSRVDVHGRLLRDEYCSTACRDADQADDQADDPMADIVAGVDQVTAQALRDLAGYIHEGMLTFLVDPYGRVDILTDDARVDVSQAVEFLAGSDACAYDLLDIGTTLNVKVLVYLPNDLVTG